MVFIFEKFGQKEKGPLRVLLASTGFGHRYRWRRLTGRTSFEWYFVDNGVEPLFVSRYSWKLIFLKFDEDFDTYLGSIIH